MRALLSPTLDRLRAALPRGRGSCTLPFAEEVVRQVAHPVGAPDAPDPSASEARAAALVLSLLDAAFSGLGDARGDAARRLAADPPTLAAFFQNLDLLADCAQGHAGAVAALVAAALEEPGP